MTRHLALALLLTGCTPGLQGDPPVLPGDDDDAVDDDDTVDLTGACLDVGGTSTLPGACIRMDAQDGLMGLEEAAAGVQIPYTILVESPIDGVVPLPQDAGNCASPGPSGLTVFERLQGGGQVYCLCDEGLCPGPDTTPRTLPAGATAATFEWAGLNWTGPSDTNFPPGDPFPAGIYTLSVSAQGRVNGENFVVANTFTVTLSE